MENHGYSQVVGSPSAPFENTLLEQCGLAANFHAETHPSLPNYIAATSGDTQGVTDDGSPAAHPLGSRPASSARSRTPGSTWRSYQESAPGELPSHVRRPVRGPATIRRQYYTGIRDDCATWDVPMGTTAAGNLLYGPRRGHAAGVRVPRRPNLCNDTHDCSVATGDAWLEAWFARIVASARLRRRSTVIFLTWDEDEHTEGNRIPTIVVSPSTHGRDRLDRRPSATTRCCRTTEELLGIPEFLGHAADPTTNSMRADFNL